MSVIEIVPEASNIIYGLSEKEAPRYPNLRIVKVDIKACLNLAKKDIFGLSDPYCRLKIFANANRNEVIATLRTPVQKKTLNPVWNSSCFIRVDICEHALLFEIFDENRLTRDDFLGEVELSLSNVGSYFERARPKKYILHRRSIKSRVRGDILLRIGTYDEEVENNEIDAVDGFQAGAIIRDFTRIMQNEEPLPNEPGWESVSRSSISEESEEGGNHRPSFVVENTQDPLPDGWEERQDANGRTFYVNHDARSTTWIRPDRDTPTPNRSSQQPFLFNLRRHISQDHSSTAEDDNLENSNTDPERASNASLSEESEERGRSSLVENSQDSLPGGWEERQDANGRTFYVNHQTRSTTWTRPDSDTPTPTDSSEPFDFNLRRHISRDDSSTTEDDNTHDRNALPQGWEARTMNNGQILYIDHNTCSTSWTRPRSHTSTSSTSETTEPSAPPPELDSSSISTIGSTENEAGSVSSTGSTIERLHPDVPSQSEIPLPPGWAMQLAANNRVFFIDHNRRITSWADPRVNNEPVRDLGPLPPHWEERTNQDGRVFFIDHETQSTQWEDPRIQKMVKKNADAIPYSRNYKKKYDYFRSRLIRPERVPNKYEILIRRSHIMEDSFRFVLTQCPKVDMLKTKMWIVFAGETGLDYGGVSREWFFLLSKEIFNPYYGLFEYSATDNYTLQINPNSGMCNEDHLQYFKFIGRVAGMACYHSKLLDAFFIRPFYKMMLGKKITLLDMESVDSEYYRSLVWLLNNDPEPLELRFQVEEEVFGEVIPRDLKKNGENIPVTNQNKQEYIDLVIKWRFVDRIDKQMNAFMEGFQDIIPKTLIQVFDERELEYLLCGLGEIDVDDWRKNTQYRSGYHDKHVVIQWFWKAVVTFDKEMKARLLQFVTGTSRVPMNGFTELYGSNGPQKFTIERWGNKKQLPRSHTCFNRLDLPWYDSYHELREKLRLAIENTEGFEGVD